LEAAVMEAAGSVAGAAAGGHGVERREARHKDKGRREVDVDVEARTLEGPDQDEDAEEDCQSTGDEDECDGTEFLAGYPIEKTFPVLETHDFIEIVQWAANVKKCLRRVGRKDVDARRIISDEIIELCLSLAGEEDEEEGTFPKHFEQAVNLLYKTFRPDTVAQREELASELVWEVRKGERLSTSLEKHNISVARLYKALDFSEKESVRLYLQSIKEDEFRKALRAESREKNFTLDGICSFAIKRTIEIDRVNKFSTSLRAEKVSTVHQSTASAADEAEEEAGGTMVQQLVAAVQQATAVALQTAAAQSPFRCFACGEVGHKRSQCPKRQGNGDERHRGGRRDSEAGKADGHRRTRHCNVCTASAWAA